MATRNPGRWFTLRGVPRADKAVVRIHSTHGPRWLKRRGIPGRFVAWGKRSEEMVRIMFVFPWQEGELGCDVRAAVITDKRKHGIVRLNGTKRVPLASESDPAEEQTVTTPGADREGTRTPESVNPSPRDAVASA